MSIDIIEHRFHAVGQGLFASGCFIEGGIGPRYRWVYDCGTTSSQSLIDRELNRLPWSGWIHAAVAKSEIELVTISHFDQDHISGLAKLLARNSIDTLLLPYVPLAERILLAFQQGINTNDRLFQLYVDPISYIQSIDGGSRIRRIIFVPPSGEGPVELPDGDVDGPPDLPVEGPMKLVVESSTPVPDDTSDPIISSDHQFDVAIEFLKPGGRLVLHGFWEFVPYNDAEFLPADAAGFRGAVDRRRKELMQASANFGGGSASQSSINDAINQLKSLYDSTFGKGSKPRNMISLFLYGGPLFSNRRHHFWSGVADAQHGQKMSVLFSGDGYLDTRLRSQKLFRFLGTERMRRVGIFQVMHHGAKANWYSGLAKEISPFASVFSSDPLRASPSHPDAEVLRDFWPYGPQRVDSDVGFSVEYYSR